MSNEYEYKLSVVLIVYNTEKYIEECLDSLVNQTLDNIEIICVNDESTDNSLNILKRYAKKYDNIRIIDQKNQGGAVAGNNGLKQAKGEYVALLDSDDIVVEDAYEKLYNKAKETDSDIVGGKPNIYMGGYQREISYKHNIWLKERTIDPNEDFDIDYDVFYWNKIYRRELIEKNDIYMIPGKLYADAPFVFKAYFYAKKITLIPDVVYYWRKRQINTSVTKSLLNIGNMHDRLATYYYLREYFKKAKKQDILDDFIKIYFERFFYPMEGILMDENFEKEYLDELTKILEDIPDIYNNKLRLAYNLYTYFVLNHQIDALKEFLMFYKDDKEIIIDNDKSYWNIKYFRNENYNIPDELFEIKYIDDNFIEIGSINVDEEFFYINNINIPKTLKIDTSQVVFIGLTKLSINRNDNILVFDLIESDSEANTYHAKVPLDKIKNINIYDIYLKFVYDDRDELFRIKETNFANINKNELISNDLFIPYFSKVGNLSVCNLNSNPIHKLEVNPELLRIIPSVKGALNYRISINYKNYYNKVYMDSVFDEELNKEIFELDWDYAVENDIRYTFTIEINKTTFDLTTDYFKDFTDQKVNYGNGIIEISTNDDGLLTMVWKT